MPRDEESADAAAAYHTVVSSSACGQLCIHDLASRSLLREMMIGSTINAITIQPHCAFDVAISSDNPDVLIARTVPKTFSTFSGVFCTAIHGV